MVYHNKLYLYLLSLMWPGLFGLGAVIMPTPSETWKRILIFVLLFSLIWIIIGKITGMFNHIKHRVFFASFLGNIAGFFAIVPSWRFAGEPLWLGILLMTLYFSTIVLCYRHRKTVHLFLFRPGKAKKRDKSNYLGWVILTGILVSAGVAKSLPGIILLFCGFIITVFFSSSAFYQVENPDWRSELDTSC